MNRIFSTFAVALVATGLAASHGIAQQATPTEAEIMGKFAKQKTRGLVIAPAGETLNAAKPAAATAVSTYSQVPAEEQVNINIRFDFDSAALREDQKPQLSSLCNVLKTGAVGQLKIVGHTDSTGSAAYNERLSLLRAEEVKRFLASNCTIADDRLQAVGVGSRFLLDQQDPKGEVNRRVEFQAVS